MACVYNSNEGTGKCHQCSAVIQGINQNIVCQSCCLMQLNVNFDEIGHRKGEGDEGVVCGRCLLA